MVALKEVFPNPTVKQVIFQVKFPNLFYIESKIGDIQMKIMKYFPESSLLFRRQIILADVNSNQQLLDLKENDENDSTNRKIWQFKSPDGVILNILSDSLDISSSTHKTYNNAGPQPKFRELIESVINTIIEITQVPIFLRIGLRYIDECPIVTMKNTEFLKSYATSFNLKRFNLEDASVMEFVTVVKKKDYWLRYKEALDKKNPKEKLILDFDGFGINISSKDFLAHLDKIHDLISDEYSKSIKQPVIDYMRKKPK